MKYSIIDHPGHKIVIVALVYLGTGLSLFSQTEKQLVIGEQPIYKVSRAMETITVDGKMDEPEWKNAEMQPLTYFFRLDVHQPARFGLLEFSHN